MAAIGDDQTEQDANEVATKMTTATGKDESVSPGASSAPKPVAAREHNETEENANEVTTGSGGVMMEQSSTDKGLS